MAKKLNVGRLEQESSNLTNLNSVLGARKKEEKYHTRSFLISDTDNFFIDNYARITAAENLSRFTTKNAIEEAIALLRDAHPEMVEKISKRLKE